jgi:flagellar basal-body rod protein FlgB
MQMSFGNAAELSGFASSGKERRTAPMAKGLDSIFNPHSQALRLLEQRIGLIGGNLANANTPGYKARDLDFAAAMAQATGSAGMTDRSGFTLRQAGQSGITGRTAGLFPGEGQRPSQLTYAGESASEGLVQYRTPLQPSLDGNTVDAQTEKAAFAEAAVRYESTLSLLSRRISGLRAVLKGE